MNSNIKPLITVFNNDDKIEGKTCLVDAPESKPIISFLNKKDWGLDKIFLTHHHSN